tara:strand:- start:57 stop:317 length:261 start_codon:yes stop_codon:yes gene_type:complete
MNPSQIKIPGHYIATNSNGKEQIVKLDQKVETNGMYYGYYGMNGFHEFVTNGENVRELTDEEQKNFSEKKYWSLPQQFYQTHPNDI